MVSVVVSLLYSIRLSVRSRAALHLEILALRHELAVVNRSRRPRPHLTTADRVLWAWLSQTWRAWRSALTIVQPATVLAWHRQGFRWFWRWKSRRRRGRPSVPADVHALIRTMSEANPLWGAPRVHGELLKLGISISQASVAKYVVRHRQPPSQTWRRFLANHRDQVMAVDFFVVPTVTYRLLFVLVLLAHDRRCIVHLAVTAHPTAAWTAQQLREACPWDAAPRYLIRDRDHAFDGLRNTAKAMGICEVLTAPGARWQNAHVERVIGSIRRECLDHVLVFNESGLHRVLQAYRRYYDRSRTHLALAKATPVPRPISADGVVVAIPEVRCSRTIARVPTTTSACPFGDLNPAITTNGQRGSSAAGRRAGMQLENRSQFAQTEFLVEKGSESLRELERPERMGDQKRWDDSLTRGDRFLIASFCTDRRLPPCNSDLSRRRPQRAREAVRRHMASRSAPRGLLIALC